MKKTEVEYALDSLSKLVEYVFEHRQGPIPPLTYQKLAARIGKLNRLGDPHPRMGRILGKMGHMFDGLVGDWGEGIPHIQSLVVNKTGKLKGLPDEGIKEFWEEYPTLSRAAKEDKTRTEYKKIVAFGSRWNEVLASLDLPKLTQQDDAPTDSKSFGKGGESEQHKALKEHVRQNPEIVGASKEWEAISEYALASLDEVDVLFKGDVSCIAVEVKSVLSDGCPDDYKRGLYQTIKYGAVLQAMILEETYGLPSQITSVLVLESVLPAQFRQLAEVLGVTVIENVKVTRRAV
ncbi:MAG: hypothetical protein HY289_09155 [Planctomycetes bacterium]|nr:hypothetical protein [Planctomycetota bacterium]